MINVEHERQIIFEFKGASRDIARLDSFFREHLNDNDIICERGKHGRWHLSGFGVTTRWNFQTLLDDAVTNKDVDGEIEIIDKPYMHVMKVEATQRKLKL